MLALLVLAKILELQPFYEAMLLVILIYFLLRFILRILGSLLGC